MKKGKKKIKQEWRMKKKGKEWPKGKEVEDKRVEKKGKKKNKYENQNDWR